MNDNNLRKIHTHNYRPHFVEVVVSHDVADIRGLYRALEQARPFRLELTIRFVLSPRAKLEGDYIEAMQRLFRTLSSIQAVVHLHFRTLTPALSQALISSKELSQARVKSLTLKYIDSSMDHDTEGLAAAIRNMVSLERIELINVVTGGSYSGDEEEEKTKENNSGEIFRAILELPRIRAVVAKHVGYGMDTGLLEQLLLKPGLEELTLHLQHGIGSDNNNDRSATTPSLALTNQNTLKKLSLVLGDHYHPYLRDIENEAEEAVPSLPLCGIFQACSANQAVACSNAPDMPIRWSCIDDANQSLEGLVISEDSRWTSQLVL